MANSSLSSMLAFDYWKSFILTVHIRTNPTPPPGGVLRLRADGDRRLLGVRGRSSRRRRSGPGLPLSALRRPEVQRGERRGYGADFTQNAR